MKLEITKTFERKYNKKSPEDRKRIQKVLLLLMKDVDYPSMRTHKIKGTHDIFEAYVTSSKRITFHYGMNSIVLRNCCQHDKVLCKP